MNTTATKEPPTDTDATEITETTEATEGDEIKILPSAIVSPYTELGTVFIMPGGEKLKVIAVSDTRVTLEYVDREEITETLQIAAWNIAAWNKERAPDVEEVIFADGQAVEIEGAGGGAKAEEQALAGGDDAMERLRRIRAAQKLIDAAHEDVEACKSSLKDAKEIWEGRVQELLGLIRNCDDLPLFAKDKLSPRDDAEAFLDVENAAGPPQAEDESWRAVELKDLHDPAISKRILGALFQSEHCITTIGEFADWQADKGHAWVAKIKGLGETGREQIENALEAFWKRRASAAEAAAVTED